ncbi:hypothetical protein BH23PLA1_BH23PLA1_04120 [soil metagenome]
MSRMGLSPILALLIAGLTMNPQANANEDPDKRQQEKRLEAEITRKVELGYLLYLPEGYDDSGEKQWPLLLFLHGAGETGSDLERVKLHGPPKRIEAGEDYPFIVVSPQAPRRGWDASELNALLDEVISEHRVDEDRVYLTGLSMGGFGTWALAAEHPERFAAIAPICGGGNPVTAGRIKDLPVWAFHGAKDQVVQLRATEDMIAALKRSGAEQVKLTVYPDAGHDSWTETYDNSELYDWFLEHKRKQ